jgi:hypothetical protein
LFSNICGELDRKVMLQIDIKNLTIDLVILIGSLKTVHLTTSLHVGVVKEP